MEIVFSKKKSNHYATKCPWWSPVLLKLWVKVTVVGFQYLSRTFSISSEHSFCRVHTNALIWSLDSFLRLLIKRKKSLTDTVSDDERKHVTTRATTPDNAWQQVTTNYNEWTLRLNFFFFKNEKVICYYTRCELLQTVVVVVDVFKIHINLSTHCHSF